MTARIFISYRTSDGVDKATALAGRLWLNGEQAERDLRMTRSG